MLTRHLIMKTLILVDKITSVIIHEMPWEASQRDIYILIDLVHNFIIPVVGVVDFLNNTQFIFKD
jgi:hypothetical protein